MNWSIKYLLKAITMIEFVYKIDFSQDGEMKKKMTHIYETRCLNHLYTQFKPVCIYLLPVCVCLT